MNQFNFLLIFVSYLSCIINNKEVLARVYGGDVTKLSLTDPRLQPQKYCYSAKCTPTIRPLPKDKIDMNGDIKDVYSALDRLNTQEHVVITLITRLSSIQRVEFAQGYNKQKHKFLQGHARFETTGQFKQAILAVLTPVPLYYADDILHSIDRPAADESTLAEIFCTVNNFGIKSIVEFYTTLFKKSLKDEVVKDTKGSFQKVIVSWIEGKRGEGQQVDNAKATADAKALNGPAAKPWKTKPTFSEMFGTRSYPHLRQVFIEYKKLSGREIEADIKKEFPGTESEGLVEITKCVRSKLKFFADKLEESMRHNSGIKMDGPLIRIIVARSEIDLEDIKKEYEKIYKKSLESVVASKIGGDYRRTLTNMIRGNAVETAAAPPSPPKPKPKPGK